MSGAGEQYKAANVEIQIDEKPVKKEFIEDILHLSVEESLHLPSLCTLVINNDYFPGREDKERPWKHSDLLQIGKSIQVTFKQSTTGEFKEKDKNPPPMFEGDISGIDCHFTDESQAPIIVRAYDVSYRLHRGRYNRSFQNMTDSDIVTKIIKELKIQPGEIEPSGAPHDYLFQENQTNMEFLRERAFRLGYELYIQENKLHFHKPKEQGNLALEWLKEINSFRVKVSSAEQVESVEIRGWDYQQKKAIVETANKDQVITENTNGKGTEVIKKFKNPTKPKMIVVDKPIFNSEDAKKMAQALCNELGGEYVLADARGEGNTQIRVGKVVNLKKMGPYDGNYYITETRHVYHKRVYTTDFTVRGLRGGNLLTTLSPSTYLKPGQTLLVGIVTDNKDPEGLGRVKVKMPTLTEEHTSFWARVVAIGAGIQRGFDCLPEINDEVLVGFEHGDIHRPYILGGVWNGKDKPPELVDDSVVNTKVRLRTFKTRIGHKLQFVEEDKGESKSGVYIETAKKHQIRLNDSDRHIEIKTGNGHQIKMDDAGQKIEIKTSKGHQITMNDGGASIDAGASITVQSLGNLTIQAQGNIDIDAQGIITIKGKMIHLN